MVIGFERVSGLGVEEFAVGGEDEQVGITLSFGVVAEKGQVFVVGVPVDVDYDVVLFEGRGEGRIFVEGAVEEMAPGAPVAACVEKDVLVLASGLRFGCGEIFGGVAGGIEDVFSGKGPARCQQQQCSK